MKFKFSFLFVGVFLASQPASADAVRDVFDSFSKGSPGVYKTSQATHYYAGNVTARIHQPNTPDLVGFTAPDIKSGCGGIDFYAGGFSLISGDEVVQMARGIAQGAAPYFFNLAISSICANCAQAMENLSARLNEINQFAKASCQSFYKGVDDATGWQDAASKNSLIEPYMFDDKLGLNRSWTASVMDAINTRDPSSGAQAAISGNVTFNLLTAVFGSGYVDTYQFFSSKDGLKELLMSLIGTGTASYIDDSGTPPKKQYTLQPAPSEIDPLQLILKDKSNENSPYTFKRLVCDKSRNEDPKCLSVRYVEETMFPLEKQYYDLLAGTGGQAGIFVRLQSKMQMDTAQIEFMKTVDFPYTYIAIRLRDNPGTIDAVSRYIAQRAAFKRVASLYNIAIAALFKAKGAKWGDPQDQATANFAQKSIADLLAKAQWRLNEIEKADQESAKSMIDELTLLKSANGAASLLEGI